MVALRTLVLAAVALVALFASPALAGLPATSNAATLQTCAAFITSLQANLTVSACNATNISTVCFIFLQLF